MKKAQEIMLGAYQAKPEAEGVKAAEKAGLDIAELFRGRMERSFNELGEPPFAEVTFNLKPKWVHGRQEKHGRKQASKRRDAVTLRVSQAN